MKISTSSVLSSAPLQDIKNSTTTNSFSKCFLNNIASQKRDNSSGSSSNLLAEVKEKGVLNYVQEQRDAELRAKNLQAIGITEEELAALPPDERANIEELIAKAIAEEIKKQQAVSAEVKEEKDPSHAESVGQFSFQVSVEQTGMKAALFTLDIVLEKRMAYMDEKRQQTTTIEILEDILRKNVDLSTSKL